MDSREKRGYLIREAIAVCDPMGEEEGWAEMAGQIRDYLLDATQ